VGATRIWLPELRDAASGMTDALKEVDRLPRDPVLITAFLAKDPASLLIRLKSSTKDVERGRAIAHWRDDYPDPKHPAAVRRWLSQLGEYASDLLELRHDKALAAAVDAVRARNDPLTLKDLAVNGEDLIATGVRPGPDVGERLRQLLDEVLEDPTRNTRDYLLSRV
jgi:tRNA nucleotidyltransferase (CCA-adding enzyme)